MPRRISRTIAALLTAALCLFPGCMPAPVDAQADRVLAAQLEIMETTEARPAPPPDLTLESVIDYALLNNLTVRAAELEYAIEHEVKTAAALRMLPSLQANAAIVGRDRVSASSSESFQTGKESLEPSFSSERTQKTADIGVIWSLMDFGLSYIRTRQAQERERMAEQNLRRLRQQIVMDATIAYYRLRAAEDIQSQYASIERAIRIQLDVFKDQVANRHMAKDEANRRAIPLLLGLKSLRELSKEHQSAKINLAKAMGVARPEDIVLAPDPDWADRATSVNRSVEELYEIALVNRPELFRADADARISHLEARSALLQLAPNVNLSASIYGNPDKYLVYHNWMDAAVRASWDLLRLPSKYKEAKTAEQRAELSKLRVNVAAASILVQINLALLELEETRGKLSLLDEIEATRRGILETVTQTVTTGKGHNADALAERIRYINDYASRAWGMADHMAAHARLISSLGLDPGVSLEPELEFTQKAWPEQ